MRGIHSFLGLVLLAAPFMAGCSDAGGPDGTTLIDVSPAPGATAVATSTTLSFTFFQPMMAGTEQYFDLHRGGIGGPVVPMTCAWNPEQTTLTCIPTAPLALGTQYTSHMGGGMSDDAGHMVTMQNWTTMGGQWATGGMMGGTHAGQPIGMMGSNWRHGSNHYGMLFEFTTS